MRSSTNGNECRVKYDSGNLEKYKKDVRTWFSGMPSKIKTRLAECPNNGQYRLTNTEQELRLSLVLDGDIPTYLDQNPLGGIASVRHDGGKDCWKQLNAKVYWLLIATVDDNDPILDAVERENGRAAWLKLIEGDVSFEVKIQLLEKRLEQVECKNPEDFNRFYGEMIRIKDEWNGMAETQNGAVHL